MYIQCTQKLLAKLKQPYGFLPNPPDSRYCWHANYLDYRGSLYIVILSDETGAELFFPLDSFQGLDKQILADMKSEMVEDGASAEEAEAYLHDAGPITFGPSADRNAIAQLTGYTRRMKGFLDRMHDLGSILESETELDDLSFQFDEMIQTCAEKEEKKKAKQKRLRTSIPRTLMIELDVELLLLGKAKVQRSFLVPLEINFESLHVVLQTGFGWSDSHLHEFDFSSHGFKLALLRNEQFGGGFEPVSVHDEEITMLSDLLPSVRQFTYIYDLGDQWEHVIKVGKVACIDALPHVVCTSGCGLTPPEDCGGPSGYKRLRAILKKPSREEYDEHQIWVGYDFDGGFDKDSVNEDLKELVISPLKV